MQMTGFALVFEASSVVGVHMYRCVFIIFVRCYSCSNCKLVWFAYITMYRRKADIRASNKTAGQAAFPQRTISPTNTKSATPRTAAQKLNDYKAYHQQKTHLRSQHKSKLCFRSIGTTGRNICMCVTKNDEMAIVPRTRRECHCFQCATVIHEDLKWSMLFQSPQLNAATRIAWFLPQRVRNIFIIAAKGTLTSYKIGLPQLCRVCTTITIDGLCFQQVYHEAWVTRLHNQPLDVNEPVDDNDGPLFPRTIFGGIAQFLDFDEINTVSITHTFMRCFIKSEMSQLRCFKVRDFSDMSVKFRIIQKAVSLYNRCYISTVSDNNITIQCWYKYLNAPLTILAGLDRVYKFDIENKHDTFRQSHEGRYRVILQKIFIWYMQKILNVDVDLLSIRGYLTDQTEHDDDDVIIAMLINIVTTS